MTLGNQKKPLSIYADEMINSRFFAESGRDPINVILEIIGKSAECERVYICERNDDDQIDNTYEWCAPGIISEIDMLQNNSSSLFDLWYEQFSESSGCIVQNVDDLKDTAPDLYKLLSKQLIRTVIVMQIVFRGTDLGFLAVDNPRTDDIERLCETMLENRFLLAELIRNRNLTFYLKNTGYMDTLSQIGNRHALFHNMRNRKNHDSIGIYIADIIGLRSINEAMGHDYGDNVIKDTAAAISAVFGLQNAYRFGDDVFIGLYFGGREEELKQKSNEVRNIMEKQKIQLASGVLFEAPWTTDFNALLRRINLRMYDDKRDKYKISSDKPVERNLLNMIYLADLKKNTIRCLYSNIDESTGEECSLDEHVESICRHIHPEDLAYYKQFWNADNIRKILTDGRHDDGVMRTFRYMQKSSGKYIWIDEKLNLSQYSESEMKVILTVQSSGDVHAIHPMHESFMGEKDDAPAAMNMYREKDFFNRAYSWLQQSQSDRIIMMAADFGHFKLYNSIFGKQAGNHVMEMLQSVLLKLSYEHHGLAGYMGGDNFVLLMPMGDKTNKQIAGDFELSLRQIEIPSLFAPQCGLYITSDRSESASEMYEKANLALDMIKGRSDELIYIFDPDHYQKRKEQQLLIMDIEKAMMNDEFIFFLQPKVNINTGKLISFEALVRWKKGDRIIPPGVFVELMENAGNIKSLDMIILDKVCRWMKARMDQGKNVIPVSVNLSRNDFQTENMEEIVNGVVLSYGIEPRMIQVEVTESSFAEDEGEIQRSVDRLHDQGHLILLDDFGKGYSSLNALHSMNFDVLKLDKKFVDDINSDVENQKIVEQIIKMAHMIGLLVVAEGVETKAQAEKLISLNCNYCQGYYFYKPMPVEEADILLDSDENIQFEKPYQQGLRFDNMNIIDFLDEKMITPAQLDKLIGPVAIFEVTDKLIHILQLNDAYAEILRIDAQNKEEREGAIDKLEDTDENIRHNFAMSEKEPGFRSQAKYYRSDGSTTILEASIYPLSHTDHASFYLVALREMIP